jgi:hypothetical protein
VIVPSIVFRVVGVSAIGLLLYDCGDIAALVALYSARARLRRRNGDIYDRLDDLALLGVILGCVLLLHGHWRGAGVRDFDSDKA